MFSDTCNTLIKYHDINRKKNSLTKAHSGSYDTVLRNEWSVIWRPWWQKLLFRGQTPTKKNCKRKGLVQKSENCYISHTHGEATSEPVIANFCMLRDMADLIMCAHFGVYKLRGCGYMGVEFSHLPLKWLVTLTGFIKIYWLLLSLRTCLTNCTMLDIAAYYISTAVSNIVCDINVMNTRNLLY